MYICPPKTSIFQKEEQKNSFCYILDHMRSLKCLRTHLHISLNYLQNWRNRESSPSFIYCGLLLTSPMTLSSSWEELPRHSMTSGRTQRKSSKYIKYWTICGTQSVWYRIKWALGNLTWEPSTNADELSTLDNYLMLQGVNNIEELPHKHSEAPNTHAKGTY